MSIPNFDHIANICSPFVKPLQNEAWAPQHHFRWCIVGPSGSGKTNALLYAILYGMKYDRLYLYAKDLTEPKYVFLQKMFNTMEQDEEMDGNLMHVSSTDDGVIPVDELSKNLQHIVIFDDWVLEKQQAKMIEYWIRGRKRNVSCIYISQNYFGASGEGIPKVIRLNSNYFSIYNVPSRNQLIQLCKEHCASIDFKEFQKLYADATRDKHDFLFIDKVTNIDMMKFRRNFLGILNDT